MLLNDPFWVPKSQLPDCTDRQIWELHLKPAWERQRQRERIRPHSPDRNGHQEAPKHRHRDDDGVWRQVDPNEPEDDPKSKVKPPFITPREDVDLTDDKGQAVEAEAFLWKLCNLGMLGRDLKKAREKVEKVIAERKAHEAKKKAEGKT